MSDTKPGMLARGFTTVRDVGGANKHYANATAEWLIPGPRLYQGGPVMSQTGGHGEIRFVKVLSVNTSRLIELGDSVHDPDGPLDTCAITPRLPGTNGAVADGRKRAYH